jgi:hypothetical protein
MMTKTFRTFETLNRDQFTAILRACRADKSLTSYGRLERFGRSLTTDAFQVVYPAWTPKPSMNIHRAA